MKKANRQKGVIAKTAANAIAAGIVTVVGTVIAMTAVSAIAVVIVTVVGTVTAMTAVSAIAVVIVNAIIKNRQLKSLIIAE